MKMIILAAGEGTRLRPLTNDKPKCMVEFKGKPIIDYILKATYDCGINDIAIVSGYKKNILEDYLVNDKLNFYTNNKFDSTNMVSTLFCAKDFMDDDIIISYADIIYKKEVLQKLITSTKDFSVVVDTEWKELWSIRMEDPLSDLETLKIEDDKIIELGKKPKSYDDIEGQYIGLIKISKSAINKVINFYNSLDRNKLYDGKDYDNIFMTSLIQMIINNNLMNVNPIYTKGGWIEIDSINDINAYKNKDITL
jgi:L-glutamine-phosphate cytidylyltransferase